MKHGRFLFVPFYVLLVFTAEELSHHAVFEEFGCIDIEMFMFGVQASCDISTGLYENMMLLHGLIDVISTFMMCLSVFVLLYILKW